MLATVCTKCGVEKGVEEFESNYQGRRRHQCRDCFKAVKRAWYYANRERALAKVAAYRAGNHDRILDTARKYRDARGEDLREYRLDRRFGISSEEYEQLLAHQGGVCAICRKPETQKVRGKVKRLAVDHCHGTDAVRGLLCSRCNTALGKFYDSVDVLQSAINYLRSAE